MTLPPAASGRKGTRAQTVALPIQAMQTCAQAVSALLLLRASSPRWALDHLLHAPPGLACMAHLLGYSAFSCLNSCSMVSRGRSEMSSMFSHPITCFLSAALSLAYRGVTLITCEGRQMALVSLDGLWHSGIFPDAWCHGIEHAWCGTAWSIGRGKHGFTLEWSSEIVLAITAPHPSSNAFFMTL